MPILVDSSKRGQLKRFRRGHFAASDQRALQTAVP